MKYIKMSPKFTPTQTPPFRSWSRQWFVPTLHSIFSMKIQEKIWIFLFLNFVSTLIMSVCASSERIQVNINEKT